VEPTSDGPTRSTGTRVNMRTGGAVDDRGDIPVAAVLYGFSRWRRFSYELNQGVGGRDRISFPISLEARWSVRASGWVRPSGAFRFTSHSDDQPIRTRGNRGPLFNGFSPPWRGRNINDENS